MGAAHFRIGYFDRVARVAFDRTAQADPTLEVIRFSPDDPHETISLGLEECHGYYARSSRDELPRPFHVTPDFIARMQKLLFIASYGAGYDTIEVDACTRAGIAVANQSGGNAEGVAEHTVGMMLALLKRIPEAHAAMRAGAVTRREAFMGHELVGRTIGIVGLGNVGSRTAQILKAFGCRVIACDPYLDAATCAARDADKVDLATLLAESDIVTVHCPLTAETRGMFGAKTYAAMRPGAIFITTARGSIHEEGPLHEALVSGHLAGAGLDVWEKEPPPADHPLLAHPAVIASVHTAGVTHESRARVATMAAEAFIAAAAGLVPPRLLNPEVLPRYTARWSAAFGRSFPGGVASGPNR